MFPRQRLPEETGSLRLDTASIGEGYRVVIATGDIDAATVSGFSAALRAARDDGIGHVVADLTEVSFLGCAGLAALVEAEVWFGSITVISDSRAVRRAFSALGLDGRFSIEPAKSLAVAQVRAS